MVTQSFTVDLILSPVLRGEDEAGEVKVFKAGFQRSRLPIRQTHSIDLQRDQDRRNGRHQGGIDAWRRRPGGSLLEQAGVLKRISKRHAPAGVRHVEGDVAAPAGPEAEGILERILHVRALFVDGEIKVRDAVGPGVTEVGSEGVK